MQACAGIYKVQSSEFRCDVPQNRVLSGSGTGIFLLPIQEK